MALLIVFGGRRDRTKKLARIVRKMKIKPRVLVAQAKVEDTKSEESIKGKKIPPKDPAQLAIPVANPRRTLNQWPIVVTATVDRSDDPTPAMIEKTRMKCQ